MSWVDEYIGKAEEEEDNVGSFEDLRKIFRASGRNDV